jgi:thiol-disulfide isomerase/thioredoxin
MSDVKKPGRKLLARAAVGIALALAAVAVLATVRAPRGSVEQPDPVPADQPVPGPGDQAELGEVYGEWKRHPGPPDARAKAEFTERCLAIARRYPGTTGALSALQMAIAEGDGAPAAEPFVREIGAAPLPRVAHVLNEAVAGWPDGTFRPFAAATLARAKSALDRPEGPLLLACVCRMAGSNPPADLPAEFREAADLLVERFPTDPAAAAVPEVLGANTFGRFPPWAGQFERHLRTLLKISPVALVRSRSAFALACLLQTRGDAANSEVAGLLEPLSQWDGPPDADGESKLAFAANRRLKTLRSGAVGMPAPVTAGPDLDGKDLSLAGCRGKVVLVVFWATWCGPCMEMVPHEVALAAKYRGRPFEILGINCDADPAAARAAAGRAKMTWRSLRRQLGPADPPDSTRVPLGDLWEAEALPTVCLVDPSGVVRRRWTGKPPAEELDDAVDRLVAAAEAEPAPPGGK